VEGFTNLANAAREFIDERLRVINENPWGDYTEEDQTSAQRECDHIEQEIALIERLLKCAQAIVKMKQPSIDQLLRRQGFGFEADRVTELVAATKQIELGQATINDSE